MANHIRHLAVYIDEPDHGSFHWVLIESTEDASVWLDVEASTSGYDLWLDAFTAGNKALLKHVPDERIGPRVPGEDEDASPVGS